MPEFLQFAVLRPDRRRGLCAGRARLHADLQRVRRHQFRARRIRDARRHGDGVPAAAGVPLPLAALLAILATVAVGLLLHRFAIEPARGASAVTLIIITIGASIFLRGAAQVVFDKQLPQPAAVVRRRRRSASAARPSCRRAWWCSAARSSIVVALWLFFDRTLFGKAMLATAANRLAAHLVGINTRGIVGFSFAVSAAIGALAGILITPITLTSYDVGTMLALKGFAAAMLGGIGSPFGAVAGGLLLGLLERFGAGYLSSHYKDAVAFLIILAVLFAMPQRPVRPARGRAGMMHARVLASQCCSIAGAGARALGRRCCRCCFRPASIYHVARAGVHLRARLDRPEPADGLCRPGQPRPCRLLRHRRLCGRHRCRRISGLPSWPALVAGAALSGAARLLVGRPILRLKGHYLAVATLGFGLLIADRLHQRSALDRRARRHGGPASRRCSAGRCAVPRPGTGSRRRAS